MIKTYSGPLAAAGLAVTVALGGCGEQPVEPPPLPKALNTQQLIKAAGPGVVAIKVRTEDGTSTGTGFMIGQREVLTAGHVAVNAENLKVRFQDGTSIAARIKGETICGDKALLELTQDPPKGTPILPMADDAPLDSNAKVDLLHYGAVAAKGSGNQAMSTSPLTVANPNVANPELPKDFPRLTNLVQLQGVAVPGASGAPMLDANGRVAGMFVMSETKASQGYALSMGDIRRTLPDLRKGVRLGSTGLDLMPLSQVDFNSIFVNDPDYGVAGRRVGKLVASYARSLLRGMRTTGMYVNWTADGSPAFRKVYSGQVITHVNGVRVSSLRGVCGVLESVGPGARLTLRGVALNSGTRVRDIGEPFVARLKLRD